MTVSATTWGFFSGIGIMLADPHVFKLFRDLFGREDRLRTLCGVADLVRAPGDSFGVVRPCFWARGHNALIGLTDSISPWTANQIGDFATSISRFASYESNGVFGPLAAVLLFGLLFVGAWALLGLFALQPIALYLLGVGLALMIGFMIHPEHRGEGRQGRVSVARYCTVQAAAPVDDGCVVQLHFVPPRVPGRGNQRCAGECFLGVHCGRRDGGPGLLAGIAVQVRPDPAVVRYRVGR